MSLLRSRSTELLAHRSATQSTRKLQEALYTHLNDLEKGAFIDALSQYRSHRDIFELVNALRKILNDQVKRRLFPLVRGIIRPGDVEAFDLLISADKQSGTLPRPTLYRPHIADINVLIKSRAASLPETTPREVSRVQDGHKPRHRQESQSQTSSSGTLTRRGHQRSPHRFDVWKNNEGDPNLPDTGVGSRQQGDKHKTYSVRSGTPEDASQGEIFEIDIGEMTPDAASFGFTIRGGVENDMGVYVSSVDHGSNAYRNGLTVGDLILEVNNISFRGITHSEAVKIIKAARKLNVQISRVGRIPGSYTVLEAYRWTDPKGRPVSPPPEGLGGSTGDPDDGRRRSGSRMLQGSDERKINILVRKGQGLGLMVRGGKEYGLGIFVSGIDPSSVAENAGIKVGDQILDVNGISFLHVSHSEAVKQLKMSRHLILTVRDIGKIPFAKTTIEEKGWIESTRVNTLTNTESIRSLSGSLQNLDLSWANTDTGETAEKLLKIEGDTIHESAKLLLNPKEHTTLSYYLEEYKKLTLSIEGLVSAMLELFNTPAKRTLMSPLKKEIRSGETNTFEKLLKQAMLKQSLTNARKNLPPDRVSLASYDSVDIKTVNRSKRTMFPNVATPRLAETKTMQTLDFTMVETGVDNTPAVGEFHLAGSTARRLSRSTPDLSALDRGRDTSRSRSKPPTLWSSHRSRSRSRSKRRPISAFQQNSRDAFVAKSDDPSDDSGVEINYQANRPGGSGNRQHHAAQKPYRSSSEEDRDILDSRQYRGMMEKQATSGHRGTSQRQHNTINLSSAKKLVQHAVEVHRTNSHRSTEPERSSSLTRKEQHSARSRLQRHNSSSTTDSEVQVQATHTLHRSRSRQRQDPNFLTIPSTQPSNPIQSRESRVFAAEEDNLRSVRERKNHSSLKKILQPKSEGRASGQRLYFSLEEPRQHDHPPNYHAEKIKEENMQPRYETQGRGEPTRKFDSTTETSRASSSITSENVESSTTGSTLTLTGQPQVGTKHLKSSLISLKSQRLSTSEHREKQRNQKHPDSSPFVSFSDFTHQLTHKTPLDQTSDSSRDATSNTPSEQKFRTQINVKAKKKNEISDGGKSHTSNKYKTTLQNTILRRPNEEVKSSKPYQHDKNTKQGLHSMSLHHNDVPAIHIDTKSVSSSDDGSSATLTPRTGYSSVVQVPRIPLSNRLTQRVDGYTTDKKATTLTSTSTSQKNVTNINVTSVKQQLEAKKIQARQKYGEIFLDIVFIYRSKPTLGVAIEGGANTRQPLPKVINVQPGGSAFESGGLKVGHVILEVNGQPVVGLSHNEAARLIAEAFKSRTSDRMELLITEWTDRLLDTIQVDVGMLKVD